MKITKVIIILTSIFMLLTACVKSAPACSDQKSLDLVKKVLTDMGYAATIGFKNVTTVGKNKDTGAQSCTAQLDIPNSPVPFNLSYVISLSDDGKQVLASVNPPTM